MHVNHHLFRRGRCAARDVAGCAPERAHPRSRRFQVEGLEDRHLLAVALPDIAMISATTGDSRSVGFTYDIAPKDLGAPVRFDVYRSADDRFDSSDIPIGSV